jgi:hypothetical protein
VTVAGGPYPTSRIALELRLTSRTTQEIFDLTMLDDDMRFVTVETLPTHRIEVNHCYIPSLE